MFDESLMKKGKSIATDALLEQAAALDHVAETRQQELGEIGYTAEKRQKLSETRAKVAKLAGDAETARQVKEEGTRSEESARAAFKLFTDTLRTSGPMILRGGVYGVSADELNAGGPLGRSTKKMLGYAAKVAPLVEKLEEPLKPFFRNQSPKALFKTLRDDLESADAAQEYSVKALPQKTAELNYYKGVLLEQMEDLIRYGRIRFAGQAQLAALFNKDILLRSRLGKRASQVTSLPEEPQQKAS